MKKVLFAALFLLAIPATAQAQRWEMLGQRAISRGGDRDTIYTRHKGMFKGLRFVITRNTVKVHRLEVHFANGTRSVLRVNRVFRPGESSGYIDMPGRKRLIKRVVFYYKTIGPHRKGNAHVVLYGRH